MVQARANFFERLKSVLDVRLVLNIDQVWRSGHAGANYCLRKNRNHIGAKSKKTKKPSASQVHQNVQQARKSITVMTASWGDMTPGPIALHIPQGMVREADVRSFNEQYRGRAYALYSEGSSHFMTSQTFNELLTNLYNDAFKLQRKHSLSGSTKGMFPADSWTGFHAVSQGEDLVREAFSRQHNVATMDRKPGCMKALSCPFCFLPELFLLWLLLFAGNVFCL